MQWAKGNGFASLVGKLRERVWSAAEMAKEEKRKAARVCLMAGKKLNRLI
jgi:hypothetical protein